MHGGPAEQGGIVEVVDSNEADPNRLPCSRGTRLNLEPRDPGLDDVAKARQWVAELPRPWAVDLFCGAGGLSLGLEEAGLNVVAGADSDSVAMETHASGIGGLSWCGDLEEPSAFLEFLEARGVTEVDVVAGGPPCQPFSRAGRAKIRSLIDSGVRSASDPRVQAWKAYASIVESLSPRIVLLENVPDMARWNDGLVLGEILTMLRKLGYEPYARILHGEEFGVPQHRMRLFVVAIREGQFNWPRKRRRVTLRDAIADLPPISGGQKDERLPYGGPKTAFQKRARRSVSKADIESVYDHISRDVRQDDYEAFSLLEPGGTYANLPTRLQRYRADIFTDKYKRLSWDSVARTITAHLAKDGYWYVHPSQPRTISIREAARIQTFPDWFRFAGHPTTQFRQIGNAVPPALGRAVGQRIVAALATVGEPQGSKAGHLVADWYRSSAGADRERSRSNKLAWRLLLHAVVFGIQRPIDDARVKSLFEAATSPGAVLNGSWQQTARVLRSLGREGKSEAVRELARAIEDAGGTIPATETDLARLPGVSPTAAATIAVRAFNQSSLILDTPSRRVASRLVGRHLTSDWHARLELLNLAGSGGPAPEFSLGVQKVGRELCTPTDKNCNVCPLVESCASSGVPK